MNSRINLVCSILALLCFVSMFVPVIAPRYPADEYYAREGNDDYYYTGDYYLAKQYWSVTDYVFSANSVLGRIVLSVDQAVLLLWALLSVRGEAGRKGLIAPVLNLVVVGAVLVRMMGMMWGCRWLVLAIMALDMAASVVLAACVKG